ncbi:IS1 family transposase [Clostridium chrysemydis]|uniref:IS1 family transposase n=1 Tax=Clostridium chrysemydis TaxID=2665504 RepID=UPI0018835DFE|nr:IS1 family transposase [Clostridium chrysemydis]
MKEINYCPHCKSDNFRKHGFYRNKRRFLCKNCLKTFSKRNESVSYYSKKSDEIWSSYIDLFDEGYSIRLCSKLLKINIKTAFYWRHKILKKIIKENKTDNIGVNIGIKTYWIKENKKGTKIYSPKRKKHLICCTKSFTHNISGKILLDNKFNLHLARNNFKERFPFHVSNSLIGTDVYSRTIATNINKNLKLELTSDLKMKVYTELNNVYLSHKGWLKKFKGIATKYYDLYFSWFSCVFENIYCENFSFNNILKTLII